MTTWFSLQADPIWRFVAAVVTVATVSLILGGIYWIAELVVGGIWHEVRHLRVRIRVRRAERICRQETRRLQALQAVATMGRYR